jgi:adenylate cyclase
MRRHAVPVGVAAVALVVAGLRWGGLLEGLELRAYDAFLGLQVLPAVPEPPITIIGVNEQDIRTLGHYPLTDEEVAALLTDVVDRGARAVGLDIYRDIEVGPGRAKLNEVLIANPEVMAVMQVATPGTAVAPPAVLKDSDRVGFADQVVDADGVIRRCLMFMGSDDQTYYSLGLRVALAYLKPMGIVPQRDERNPAYMRLGKVAIRPFGAYDGPYVRADAGGYQFLLDYRGPRHFPRFSLSDVRDRRVPAGALKDKIVLIGVTAESMKDYVNVPGQPNLHGVEMQGICVDQLLRIALYGHKPMGVPREWQEGLWIVGVIVLGGLLGTWAQSLGTFLLVGAAGLGAIVLTAFVVFCFGWWVPVVPAGAGWLGAWLLAGPYRPRKRKLT